MSENRQMVPEDEAFQSVVIVEDCADGAQILGKMIGQLGHRVRVAHDATSAFELLEQERADMMIIDLGLPGMDGCELATLARLRFGKNLQIVVLTGQESSGYLERARMSGINQFHSKPLEPSQIVQILDNRLPDDDGYQKQQFAYEEVPMMNSVRDCAPSILVVDDDDDIRESVIEILKDDGYLASGARDGSEAMALLSEPAQEPDLILLDLKMPNMDGFEFRQWQETHPSLGRIPVVAFTADVGAMDKAQNLHASGVVRKPFQVDTLLAVIARVFDARSARM